jgi:DNA polymerase III delta prime subunit
MSTHDLIWYERYRPKKLSDMVLGKEEKLIFKRFIKSADIPHLLFYGPAGSGKTTLARILMKNCGGRSLILNASSEDRGIATIKLKVKQFASAKAISDQRNIIFFDEANGLTYDAQEALKNTIEKYHENCRFIFATNEFDKITDPIVSRCQVFEFNTLPLDKMKRRVYTILDSEEIEYKKKAVAKVVKRFYPDFRSIINNVQLACGKGKFNSKAAALQNQANTEQIAKLMHKGRITDIRKLVAGMTDFLWLYRYLFNEWVPENISGDETAEAAILVADYMYKNITVVDKEINMTACLIELMSIYGVAIDWKSRK